jgi:hypothetical protein
MCLLKLLLAWSVYACLKMSQLDLCRLFLSHENFQTLNQTHNYHLVLYNIWYTTVA